MKIVFMGTMNFAVPILKALDEAFEITLVVTQPDRPFGRKQELKASPVKEYAVRHDLPVFQPEKIRRDYQPVLDAQPDLIVVAAFGQMIPKILLEAPRFKCINVHASLLPKFRGGAPMHRAIAAGETQTGVTIMNMAEKMDAGDLLSQEVEPILETDNVGTLEEKLGLLGARLLLETLPRVFDGSIVPIPQDERLVTFAYNLKHEEEFLNFSGTMKQVFDHVRAFNPWPIAATCVDGMTLKVYEVIKNPVQESNPDKAFGEIVQITKDAVFLKVSDGLIGLKNIQLQGKNRMDIRSFMNGAGKTVLTLGKILK
jgi:methionyl-tRNA formyltransferase